MDELLYCKTYEHMEVPEGQTRSLLLPVRRRCGAADGVWWVEPASELPAEAQLVEGRCSLKRARPPLSC